MLYILSGVAKSGKTLLSKEIVRRYPLSVFSTDYIMMMLFRGNKNLNIDIDASDSSVSKAIEPYLYGMIKTMIENDENYVIEGVHFLTDFALRLKHEFKEKIQIVYIGYKDVSITDKVNELYSNKEKMNNPWIFNHLDQKIEDIVSYMIEESKRIYLECEDLGLKYIDVYDIDKQKEDIIHSLNI